MPDLHDACAVNDETGWHAMHFESLGERTLGIKSESELRGMLAQEALGIGTVAIDVHRDDRKPLGAECLLKMVHEREGLEARSAPGGPEIQIYDPSLEGGQINRITCVHSGRSEADQRQCR